MTLFRLAVVCVLACVSVWGWELRGLCVSVADGDTLSVVDSSGKRHRVRLYGIDCPERSQDFGREAGGILRRAAHRQQVRVEVVDKDRYGRLVGKVYVGDRYMNLEMVKLGYAWYYRHFAPDASDLESAEKTAREGKLGLWSSPEAMAPWTYRRQMRRRH